MTTELERTNGGLQIAGHVSETGLDLPDDLSFADWEQTGRTLGQIEQAVQWWLGDWLNHGERVYGETYAQAVDMTGREASTLTNYTYVAKAVPEKVRDPDLSWSHHRAVAGLDPPEQKVLLREAKQNGWNKTQLEREAKAKKDGTEPEEPKVCSECGRKLPA